MHARNLLPGEQDCIPISTVHPNTDQDKKATLNMKRYLDIYKPTALQFKLHIALICLIQLVVLCQVKALDSQNVVTLYSWAKGGLNIRDSNSRSAEIIGLIPYGDSLLFLGYDNTGKFDQIAFYHKFNEDSIVNGTVLKCQELTQKGYWIKIKYRGQIGFVFNGYTSRYKPIMGETSIKHLIEVNAHMISTDKFTYDNEDCTVEHTYFTEGISVTSTICKGGDTKYVFPNMTIEEAILFTRENIESQSKNRFPENQVCLVEKILDYNNNIIQLNFTNDTNWEMVISCSAGAVIISERVWC
jgi:hypothetical protein